MTTLRDFIRDHRSEIDEFIDQATGHVPRTASCYCPKSGTDHFHHHEGRHNDTERREWIMNDEGLYRWAHRGV